MCLVQHAIYSCETFSVGGIKRVFLSNTTDITNVLYAARDHQLSTVTSITPTGRTWYEYYCTENTAQFSETKIETSNGKYFTKTFNLAIIGMEQDKRTTIAELIEAHNHILLVWQDANDRYWIMGEDYPNGLKVSEYSAQSGLNADETNKYDLTFSVSSRYQVRALHPSYVTNMLIVHTLTTSNDSVNEPWTPGGN